MQVKKCLKCGALVKVFHDCDCENCGIKCCGAQMTTLKANASDGAVEKHVPEYVVEGDKIQVRVNHVMEDVHYIEWIAVEYDNKEEVVYFKPGQEAKATFKYVKGATIYSYCNKHNLWSKVVD